MAAPSARAAARADAAHRRATGGGDRSQARPASRRSGRHWQQLGWVDGHNVRLDYRRRGGDPDGLADTSTELVRPRPTSSWPWAIRSVGALQQATRTLPIVFVVSDPVAPATSRAFPGRAATPPGSLLE